MSVWTLPLLFYSLVILTITGRNLALRQSSYILFKKI